MERWCGKVAVVTGASAGIGAAIVTKLVENGLQVVGIARRLDKLHEMAKKLEKETGKLHPVQADVTIEDDIVKAMDWIKTNLHGLHILINNAGVFKPGTLLEGNTEIFKQILDTNVLALTVVTREAVKIMLDHGKEGHVIHINSSAGHGVTDIPLMNVYFASKYAVTALAHTLRFDLKRVGSKIRVTSLSPGIVDTEMIDEFSVDKAMAKFMAKVHKLCPEDVANAVVYVLGTPPHAQVVELTILPTGAV